MAKTLVEICTSLIVAQAQAARIEPEMMTESVNQIYRTLRDLHLREQGMVPDVAQPEASIQRDQVVCLECGKAFTLLSNRHLALHGLTPREYKRKYGLRQSQPLSARTLSAKRRKQALDLGMGQQLAAWRDGRRQGIV